MNFLSPLPLIFTSEIEATQARNSESGKGYGREDSQGATVRKSAWWWRGSPAVGGDDNRWSASIFWQGRGINRGVLGWLSGRSPVKGTVAGGVFWWTLRWSVDGVLTGNFGFERKTVVVLRQWIYEIWLILGVVVAMVVMAIEVVIIGWSELSRIRRWWLAVVFDGEAKEHREREREWKAWVVFFGLNTSIDLGWIWSSITPQFIGWSSWIICMFKGLSFNC